MTFKEYFAIKTLTTWSFAETVCTLFDEGYVKEDKETYLLRILWEDKYNEYLALVDFKA